MFSFMRKNLIAGLMILLPIAISIALLNAFVSFFTDPFVHFVSTFLENQGFIQEKILFLLPHQVILILSKFLILILLVMVTVILGLLTRLVITRFIFSLTDKILHKIPIIKTIHKTVQEVTKTLFASNHSPFKQVVLAPFPHSSVYAMGLISQQIPLSGLQNGSLLENSSKVSVLILTTPNPTSGFLLMYNPSDLIYLDLSVESALKYVVSAGMMIPETGMPG
ncbi:MAG: DUF502 domain-containing protein [Candidatus Rhabdochlamydia sp.]